ncbi:hypothetical protein [Candidatus Megaera venefica]|nr:hypothetical protein [Candidatus Megaera venefica]
MKPLVNSGGESFDGGTTYRHAELDVRKNDNLGSRQHKVVCRI